MRLKHINGSPMLIWKVGKVLCAISSDEQNGSFCHFAGLKLLLKVRKTQKACFTKCFTWLFSKNLIWGRKKKKSSGVNHIKHWKPPLIRPQLVFTIRALRCNEVFSASVPVHRLKHFFFFSVCVVYARAQRSTGPIAKSRVSTAE